MRNCGPDAQLSGLAETAPAASADFDPCNACIDQERLNSYHFTDHYSFSSGVLPPREFQDAVRRLETGRYPIARDPAVGPRGMARRS